MNKAICCQSSSSQFSEMSVKEMQTVELVDYAEVKPSSLPASVNNQAPLDDELYRRAEKSLVRKLDLTLMPTVWLLYVFNYLDRNNIAYVLQKIRLYQIINKRQVRKAKFLRERPRSQGWPIQYCCIYPQCWVKAPFPTSTTISNWN